MNYQDYYNQNKNSLRVFCEVGVYLWSYCRLHRPIEDGKKVILVEPLPRCIADIRQYILGKDNVTLYPVAVAQKHGETTIYDEGASAFIQEVRGQSPCHANGYYDVPNARQISEHEKIIVPTMTFDRIDPTNIDVLFVDVEGCEYFVIEKMISRPKIICLETHYNNYKNPFAEKIQAWMDENGYENWYKTESDSFFLKK